MACGPEDVSKVLLGELTEFSIGYLRDIKEVLGVSFKIVGGEKGVTLSCLGAGVVNLSKSAT
jgi:RNA 3'-terminal phosphate cyclase-like protein